MATSAGDSSDATAASTAAAWLDAGGLLLADQPVPDGVSVDRTAARAWRHPALGARPVIRLQAETLIPGADAEMAALGFGPPEPGGIVGVQQRRALGFPGWALVHDPGNARYALDVTRAFQAEARKASTKPGHARDGFVAIAARLGRAVPHFLPSFWEEAGRVFLVSGGTSFAASCFEKARQAEQQHGLVPDEAVRLESFLEFALAGAVPVKSLQAYARELLKARGAADAYGLFLSLCRSRTAAGMAPFTGMLAELRRLARAAGQEADAADDAVLESLLGLSGTARAPAEFWKQAARSLERLCRRDPGQRGRMARLLPHLYREDEEFRPQWLDLLAACGVTDWMAAPRGEAGAAALGEPAHFFSRLFTTEEGAPEAAFAWLRQWAPRLKADGVPLKLEDADSWVTDLDVDLLDLALELGVPVANPTDDADLDLRSWARRTGAPGGEVHPRDPVFVAADPRFADGIVRAVRRVSGGKSFERAARGKGALRAARRAWLLEQVDAALGKALPGLADALDTLEEETTPATFQEFPEALDRLRQVDVGFALARTLRGGLIDELGWAAFEDAWMELSEGGKTDVSLAGAFPAPVLWNERRAIVVGATGRLLIQDLRLPKGAEAEGFLYSQGQLLTVFRDDDWDHHGAWSGHPDRVFDLDSDRDQDRVGRVGVALPDGSVTDGGRAVSAGDTAVPKPGRVWADGTGYWRQARSSGEDGAAHPFREFDPGTGDEGRRSLPSFFEGWPQEGSDPCWDECHLHPVPDAFLPSPTGARGGLHGFRVRSHEDAGGVTVYQAERVDGVTFTGPCPGGAPEALLSLPGDPRPRPVTCRGRWRSSRFGAFDLWDADGSGIVSRGDDEGTFAGGSAAVPPLPWWHGLSPRDEPGSGALRSVRDDVAGEVLAAARRDLAEHAPGGSSEPGSWPRTDRAVAEVLPQITHPALARAVARVAAHSAHLALRMEALIAGRTEAAVESADDIDDLPDDRQARRALGGLCGSDSNPVQRVGAQIRAVGTLFQTPPGPGRVSVPSSEVEWLPWIGRSRGLAVRLALAPLAEEDRAAGLALLELWSASPFAAPAASLRTWQGVVRQRDTPFVLPDPEDDEEVAPAWGVVESDHRYFVRREGYFDSDDGQDLRVLEHAGAAGFALPSEVSLGVVRPVAPRDDAVFLQRFLILARERGPLPFDAAAAALIAERTGQTLAEATLLAAGLPRLDHYDHDFLGAELRAVLGLKVAEANLAKDALREFGADTWLDLFDAAATDDPEDLWRRAGDPLGPAARLADAFVRRVGRRLALPGELLARVEREVEPSEGARPCLREVLLPQDAPRFSRDGRWGMDGDGDVVRSDGDEPVFDGDALGDAARVLPWLASALPVGDPFRKALPALHAAVLARLSSPDLLLPLGTWDVEGKSARALKTTLQQLGGAPFVPRQVEAGDPTEGRDAGLLVMVTHPGTTSFAFRPARLDEAPGHPLFHKVVQACERWEDDPTTQAAWLRSADCREWMERIGATEVPAGGWEQDPRRSAPELVHSVRNALGIDEDAACLYLQVLALHDPTHRNLLAWNGWKAPRLAAAFRTLLSQERVLEAKRPRSGRDFFLPGGWEALKAPSLPVEAWKLPLYGVGRDRAGALSMPLGRLLPLAAPHRLFARAWGRVQAGDRPRYEGAKV